MQAICTYCRFRVGTKSSIGRIGEADTNGGKDHIPRFASCPLYGALSAARYSQNGVTVQSQGTELDTLTQLQLRLMGSRESHDTNGILGCDSLRQKMMHPETAAVQMAADGVQSSALGFDPQVIPNDKQNILLQRYETNKEIELATPISLALTAFGTNKFIPGGSHDLRFTIGQEGRNMRKSMFNQCSIFYGIWDLGYGISFQGNTNSCRRGRRPNPRASPSASSSTA